MKTFGLDISDSIIRLALLEKRGAKYRLPIRAEIPVPPGYIVDGDIKRPHDVTQLLDQLLRAANPKTRYAIVSLPERHSFIKVLSIASENSGLSDDLVRNEAMQSLPYAWDELYVDWHPLPKKNSLGQRMVAFGSAPKSIVDTYLSVLHDSGLEPVSLEIESVAVARALLAEQDIAGSQIILDLGRTRTTLALVRDGIVHFSTTLRYAGKDLNRYIADGLGITEEQAEKAKALFGLDPTRGKGLLRKVLAPHLDGLSDKIREIESFYVEHYPDHQPVSRIVLNGSGALVRSFDRELAERLDQRVVSQPSWISRHLEATDERLAQEIGYTYTTALGLTLEHESSMV